MNTVKISVIMGVYNCKSAYKLKRSIQSIISQTMQDWELIICDDGSTDRTLDLLRQIEKTDRRIRVLHYDTNVSLGNALNTCLKYAQGEYIARQDDDDVSLPDRLEKEYDFLKNNTQYCMVGCCAQIYDDNGTWGRYKVPKKPSKYDFLKNSPFMHPTMLIRKNALEIVGGYRIAQETRRCEDYDLFMRLYAKRLFGYNIQEELYQYYILRNDQKKHRSMKIRIDEAKVRFNGYRQLKLYPVGIFFVFKPIIAGIIPNYLFVKLQHRQYKD